MSETRTIIVKGDASIFKVGESSSPNAKTTRRRAKTFSETPTVFVKMGGGAADAAPAVPAVVVPANASIPAGTSATAIAAAPVADAPPPPPPAKVVLGGRKPKAMKVVLTKKNHKSADSNSSTASAVIGASSVKKQRKVTLGIQHLKRRVTKARRLNKITKSLSLDQIRKELIAAKIIKEDSKAPETILRQMYADAKLITTKSL